MRWDKLISILALVFLSVALVAVGCSGQKPGSQQSEEAIAPAEPSDEATEPVAAPSIEPKATGEKKVVQPSTEPVPQVAVPAPAPVKKQPEPVQPEPEPAPEPIVVTVPAGTVLNVTFLDPLSSKTNQVGDSFRVQVTQDVAQEGLVVIPAGSILIGSVTEAESLNKNIGGQAKLGLQFTSLELPSGEVANIQASFLEEGKSETKKDAATIGGAAAGGAILGRLLKKEDKSKGTLIGAVLGAAAGTAIAAKTKGEEVEIPAGTPLGLQLDKAVQITISP